MRSTAWTVLALVTAVGCDPPPSDSEPEFELQMETLAAEQGYSMHIPVFEVPYGQEVQNCYFIDMPRVADLDTLWVGRVRIGLRPGSHHLNIYRVVTDTALSAAAETGEEVDMGGIPARLVRGGPCTDSSNFNEWPLVVNSQRSDEANPYYDWQLPEGVAFALGDGERLMLQPHYVNVSVQKTPYDGEARINFYRSTAVDPIEMGTLFATQPSIRVCQSTPDVQYYGTCSFPAGTAVHIAALNGHFHLRGNHFSVATWDGMTTDPPAEDDIFYESFVWAEPFMSTGLDVSVPDGGGVWWTCEYEWRAPALGCDMVNAADREGQDDCCYTFGPRVSTQEHCNVFLYYWPRVGRSDIFCR